MGNIIALKISWFTVLTYSMYFSYAIFLIDYKKILKIAGGVKQLTVPLLLDPNCSMPENDAQCVIPVKCTSDHSVRWAVRCISFKTMLCPNFLMVWYADIIIFSGFVVMCM
jgi:hypothetical protein